MSSIADQAAQKPQITMLDQGEQTLAFYAWPNVTEACQLTGCRDSEEFRKRLLNEAGVAVLADIHFGQRVEGEGQHIRLSYAASDEAIREGVRRMAEFVKMQMK